MMVDICKLKATIVEKGTNQKEVYEKMGISKKMWRDRLDKKKFDSDEIYQLIHILDIKNPTPIFFADEVTQ